MSYAQEEPELPTPIVRADPNCTQCKGTGYESDGKTTTKCLCLLKREALAYLTETYASASFIKTLDVTQLKGKNLLLQATPQAKFKSIVKSFLLNTAMKNTHMTASGYDVMQAFLTNTDTRQFDKMKQVDVLILYLVADPGNKAYGVTLESLINDRSFKGRVTWVYTQNETRSQPFKFTYGDNLSAYITEKFTPIR